MNEKINLLPLRNFARFLLGRFPRGLAGHGYGSRILRPRRIRGARYIKLGSETVIAEHSHIECLSSWGSQNFTPVLEIGSRVYLGRNAYIVCINTIKIGDGCVISDQVYVADNSHGYDPFGGAIMKQPLHSKGPIEIGDDCFVGYRAVIMPGVVLGKRCVVGANSVVTRSFEAYSMVAGCPARLVRRYSLEKKSWIISGDR